MDPKQLELTQIVQRLALIIQGLIGARRQADHERQQLSSEATHLARRCDLLFQEIQHDRQQKDSVLSALKQQLAEVTHKWQTAERQLEARQRESEKWRERYSLVDEERRALELRLNRRIGSSADLEAVEVILDTQLCPECGEEHLVARHGDVYDCLYCGRAFQLQFGVRRNQPD